MYNLLIICDDFPPHGGLRAGNFYKNLTNFGWTVNVVTLCHSSPSQQYNIFENPVPIDNIKTINIKSYEGTFEITKLIKRFLKPEEGRLPGLTRKIEIQSENIIIEKKIDIIFATSSCYHSIYCAANNLSNKFDIPWIADFRDIEEQRNDFRILTNREKLYIFRVKLRRYFVLRNATNVISISKWHTSLLKKYNKNANLIFNGFDEDLYNKFIRANNIRNDQFEILYLGSLLGEETRNPEIFLSACNNLITSNKVSIEQFKFVIVGHDSEKIYEYLEKLKIYNKEWVVIKKYISHENIHEEITKSAILLLLTSERARGVMTTKFFEYLASSKPILLCPEDDGSIGDIIKELNVGHVCSSIKGTEDYIYNIYMNWQLNKNTNIQFNPVSLKIFRREYQAKQLSELLVKAISIK